MKTKPLYILVSNGGDGSYSTQYSLSPEWIDKQQARYDNGESDYEYDAGIDGDGFHYETLQVPEGMTAKDLGIRYLLEDEED